MIRTVIWLLASGISLILISPAALIAWLRRDRDPFGEPSSAARWVVEKLLPFYIRLGGCDYTVCGTENLPEGPALFTGNHQGNFDTVLILSVLGGYKIPVAKKEAEKVPLVGIWMRLLKVIFMDRKDARQSAECIKLAEEQLQHGHSIIIFPEGTRSKGPAMNEFKPGSFKPALRAQVPVVPFVIDGTYKCFEEKRRLTHAKVSVHILPAVYPEKEGITKTRELAAHVQSLIQQQLDRNAENAQ